MHASPRAAGHKIQRVRERNGRASEKRKPTEEEPLKHRLSKEKKKKDALVRPCVCARERLCCAGPAADSLHPWILWEEEVFMCKRCPVQAPGPRRGWTPLRWI
ncbi:hypothetical protein AALO_G00084610 [Alosa alosa]|uniref:Uncharacterized protein n=1 Tax=Alosa alosa TaxID=278164 RepID=A0AAV6H0B7_9TELE|nr:hypothetical protein AALO_G00084610 [Alosa alosa]